MACNDVGPNWPCQRAGLETGSASGSRSGKILIGLPAGETIRNLTGRGVTKTLLARALGSSRDV